MSDSEIKKTFDESAKIILDSKKLEKSLINSISLITKALKNKKKIVIFGNGGSAAIAGHISTDLINVCKVNALTLHDSAQLTCFCNDYGYEQGYARQLEIMARPEDLLVAISSSGSSNNIINAVKMAKEKKIKVFTLTGFKPNNPLRSMGTWNFWFDSQEYGQVEVGHLFLLHHICNQFNNN